MIGILQDERAPLHTWVTLAVSDANPCTSGKSNTMSCVHTWTDMSMLNVVFRMLAC